MMSLALNTSWRLLVVDDHPTEQTLMAGMLGRQEFLGRPVQVECASSAAEALGILQRSPSNHYALALLDVQMETPDAGLVLTKAIRASGSHADTRILLRSGHVEDILSVVEKNDVDGFLEKPCHRHQLLASVTASLRLFSVLQERTRRSIVNAQTLALAESLNATMNTQELCQTVLDGLDAMLCGQFHILALVKSVHAPIPDERRKIRNAWAATEEYQMAGYEPAQRGGCQTLAQDLQLFGQAVNAENPAEYEDHQRKIVVIDGSTDRLALLARPKNPQDKHWTGWFDEMKPVFTLAKTNLNRISVTRKRMEEAHKHWAVVSHHLMTPLANQNLLLETMRDLVCDLGNQRIEAIVSKVQEERWRMSQFLEDGSKISQAGLWSMELDNATRVSHEFEIAHLFEALKSNVLVHDAKGIEFKFVSADERVHTSLEDLKHALFSLLRNAIAACRAKLDAQATPRIEVKASKGDRGVQIEVRDTGIGMTEKQQAKIWDPFYSDSRMPSTGLGLSITAGLARLNGWKLAVQSEQVVGSYFTIFIPGKSY